MSDLYNEISPPIKDIEICLECGGKVIKDIFQVQLEDGKKLIEAVACDVCNIIYEVIS